MSTASEEILARYAKIEREADSFGRLIGVKRLRPAQQLRVSEMVDTKDDISSAMFNIAASVCEVDSVPVTFPLTRAELDSVIDMLDVEGTKAASAALGRLLGAGDPTVQVEDAAKIS